MVLIVYSSGKHKIFRPCSTGLHLIRQNCHKQHVTGVGKFRGERRRPREAEAVVSEQELSQWLMKVTETLLVFAFASLVRDHDRRSHSTDFNSQLCAASGDSVVLSLL